MQIGWLIEYGWRESPPYGLEYLSAEYDGGFGKTTDNQYALRFARQEDAQRVIRSFAIPARAVEHAWIDMEE